MNVCKESTSAVEGVCKELIGLPTHSGAGTQRTARKKGLCTKISKTHSHLYSWTSDHGGIRHSIKDADKVERADAQYMLVTCSAFVNCLFTR